MQSGLSSKEAEQLLKSHGKNSIESEEIRWWSILFRQFKSSFIYLLIVASAFSILLAQYTDAIFILLFIVINTVLGFIQEYKSEQTIKHLRSFLVGKTRVIRDGEEKVVLNSELVPGDVVVLETGDVVSADLEILESHNLMLDESILTGESVPVSKKDKLFRGTTVVNGRAQCRVIATGRDTEIGKIGKLATQTSRESAFQININKLSKFILWLVIGTLGVMLLTHLFLKTDSVSSFTELIIFSIALAVGVIPEALPLVMTFSLSRGARVMAANNVVVKRLSAIEDLGSIQVLCTDKTGTITQNKLTVIDKFEHDRSEKMFLYAALSASNIFEKEKLPNNAFDLAVIEQLDKQQKDSIKSYKLISELPFDPERRRNSVVVSDDKESLLIVRGAAEEILSQVEHLNKEERSKAEEWIGKQGTLGNRTIAIAVRKGFSKGEYKAASEVKELKLIGIIAFKDPLKPTTKGVVKKAEELGVKIKVLTGDNPVVAGAVAHEAGIINNPADVVSGQQFAKMSGSEKHQAVDSYHVFARVTPEQKLEIIKLLQEKYQVGYLGEGINDAPALKISSVALVVKGAADVAQSVADIVLLKADLEVIIEGVIEGRKTFSNTITYIKATLLSNFGNFYAVALASLVIPFLPMLPVQLLLLNLMSDFPMIAISTDNVANSELRSPKSYDIKEIILVATILGAVSSLFDFITFAVFKDFGPSVLQSSWFISSVTTELILLYSIRTRKLFFRASTPPSKYLTVLTVTALVITITLPFTSLGRSLFHFESLTLQHMLWLALIIGGYFVANETVKLLYYRFNNKISV